MSEEVEKVAFDSLEQLEGIYTKLEVHLKKQLLALLPPDASSEHVKAVETALFDVFLANMKHIANQNITIGGVDYEEYLDKSSQEIEPRDEALNRNVLAYQTRAQEAICENVIKRKTAPAKAAQSLEKAVEHLELARQSQLDAIDQDVKQLVNKSRTLVNATLPERTVTCSLSLAALSACETLPESIKDAQSRADQALQSQADVQAFVNSLLPQS